MAIFNQQLFGGGGGGTYQSKTATPSTSQQLIEPDSGYDALSSVTVEPTPLETKTVIPSSEQQIIEPTSPNIGLSSVTVNAIPTYDFDALYNGTDEVDAYISGTAIPDYGFYNCKGLKSIDAPNVVSIGSYAFAGSDLRNELVHKFPKCESINPQAFRNMVYSESKPRKIYLPKLTTLAGNALTSSTVWQTMPTVVFKKQVQLISYSAEFFYIRNNANIPAAKIYVPQRYLTHFQTDTNWVTGYTNYPNAIRTIEDNIEYLVSIGYDRAELLAED